MENFNKEFTVISIEPNYGPWGKNGDYIKLKHNLTGRPLPKLFRKNKTDVTYLKTATEFLDLRCLPLLTFSQISRMATPFEHIPCRNRYKSIV